MPVKSYKWPEGFLPHTILIEEDDDRWSFALCNADTHILIAPGQEPQFNKLSAEKVIKGALEHS